jgi:hypothetical protein
MALVTLTSRATAKAALQLIWVALARFFAPQFHTKFRPSVRPVVSVDHDLDKSIPFCPDLVDVYSRFISLWIKSTYFIYREFGRSTLPGIAIFINGLSNLYMESGRIYKTCQSTTVRPKYLKNMKFILIHAFDPHLHCVPSLHVLIVVYNYIMMTKLIEQYSDDTSEYSEQKHYMYSQAVAITESILLVKQHSVNCIPAALFAMSRLHPEFSRNDAAAFINQLFVDTDIEIELESEIKDFMLTQYQDFMDSCETKQQDYSEVLLEFLMDCREISAESD